MANPPDKVPDAVIDSIAMSYVKYQRAGECPAHDHRWQGRYVSPWDASEDEAPDDNMDRTARKAIALPCTCQIRMAKFEEILKALRWSGDHYSFMIHDMYVGVELDGYMHT